MGWSDFGFKRGCLVGNLGQVMGALDERFRVVLLATLSGRGCLDDAKRQGQIQPEADTRGLAKLFWHAWEALFSAPNWRDRARPSMKSVAHLSITCARSRQQWPLRNLQQEC